MGFEGLGRADPGRRPHALVGNRLLPAPAVAAKRVADRRGRWRRKRGKGRPLRPPPKPKLAWPAGAELWRLLLGTGATRLDRALPIIAELADAAGLGRGHVGRIITGRAGRPSARVAACLAAVLGVGPGAVWRAWGEARRGQASKGTAEAWRQWRGRCGRVRSASLSVSPSGPSTHHYRLLPLPAQPGPQVELVELEGGFDPLEPLPDPLD